MNGPVLEVGIGVLLLLLGRKLFWLFVGVVGFLSGTQLASPFLPADSRIGVLAIALALGLLGAVLAIFVQHFVVILAGFLAGGHLIISVLTRYNWNGEPYVWWLALLGGVLGGILALMLLDWALIIFSSLIGSNLVSQALPLEPAATVVIMIILATSIPTVSVIRALLPAPRQMVQLLRLLAGVQWGTRRKPTRR
jgi:hypothetical protein